MIREKVTKNVTNSYFLSNDNFYKVMLSILITTNENGRLLNSYKSIIFASSNRLQVLSSFVIEVNTLVISSIMRISKAIFVARIMKLFISVLPESLLLTIFNF